MDTIEVTSPLSDEVISKLKIGQKVLLTGTIYTARDAAHKKIVSAINNGEDYGFDITGQTVYYAGPCPAKPGSPIGPVGPTTSGRMDSFTPLLLQKGLKAMIGKGFRNSEVKKAVKENCAVYLVAVGGAGAYYMNCVKSAEFVAFEELGTEAVRKLTVEKMPLIVALDIHGGDIYQLSNT